MKTITILCLISFCSIFYCQAQQIAVVAIEKDKVSEFRPFKVGIGLGYAVPGAGDGAGGGALFFVEPAYRATPDVLIGLRVESALFARGINGIGDSDVSGETSAIMSYTLNGQYYFNRNFIRPFIGAGVGLFSMAATEFNTSGGSNVEANNVGAETRFGFYPRIGVDAGHWNLTVDYNFVPVTGIPDGGEVKNNYLAIRLGFSIGGRVGARMR